MTSRNRTLRILLDVLKSYARASARALGFEIRRAEAPPPLPALCDDPEETIHRRRSHDFVAFNCPVSQLVELNGMSFSKEGWHPFVEAAVEFLSSGVRKYEGSCLEKYYSVWQPRNAREALICASCPAVLERFPSYTRNLPWTVRTVEESAAFMTRVIEIENSSFGATRLSPEHGYGLHGPVSPQKGRLEYMRLTHLVDLIRRQSYDRSGGDVTVRVVRRDEQYRSVVVHGHHRIAALAALGHEFIPAIPQELLDVKYIAHWWSVYHGIWSEKEALGYVDHLFDFDSLRWATGLGLTSLRKSAQQWMPRS